MAGWSAIRGRRADDGLAPSGRRPDDPISARRYARLVEQWVARIGLERRAFGTHSLRRAKVGLVDKNTGNLRACQLLPGHRKLESTVRLAIDRRDGPGGGRPDVAR